MAEVKNAFIKSKMNKDLDSRLVPQGEYRDAVNIQVSKSEGDDVGALENVIGNISVADLQLGIPNLSCIGKEVDETNSIVYLFFTDNDDTGFSYKPTGVGSNHFIYRYNAISNALTKLVEGAFLNFSKAFPITGVNILENLLFFTDNRNQPRKINVNLANQFGQANYYTNEDQISVAKYFPYQPIEVIKESVLSPGNFETTMKDVFSEYIPLDDSSYTTNPYWAGNDPSGNPNFPGDPQYLEDKFVRFSYRFKFDDGEYSLIAPFTQVCFIPKQDGYFLPGDEQQTVASTIVEFMENKVNEISLQIPLPTAANNIGSDFKITELDIIYKESDGLALQVVETIPVSQITGTDTVFEYVYNSTKPYKTLPENEITRVYDKTPVKALGQEVTSNRVVYANFQDKHTPPAGIDYQVAATAKSEEGDIGWAKTNIEYPNHTLKQNRNYQVGVVLADKYGRQSTVILSNNTSQTAGDYGADTVYLPYSTSTSYDSNAFIGNSLKILFNDFIQSTKSSATGEPGLYNGDPTAPAYNPLGWYSYKIVVKQLEQEYYNVYAPGAMKGVPYYTGTATATNPENQNASFITLLNDNINKVPRDLSEVGPQDKQFRSSVELFGIVENNFFISYNVRGNRQYFPGRKSFTTNTIEDLFDLFDIDDYDPQQPTPITSPNNPYYAFYRSESNPFIAEFITSQTASNQFGTVNLQTVTNPSTTFEKFENLSILETKPIVSRLDIFWESTTSGLLEDLNTAIQQDTNGAFGIINFNYDHEEAFGLGADITGNFSFTDVQGQVIVPNSTPVLTSVYDDLDPTDNRASEFALVVVDAVNGIYKLQTNAYFYYGINAAQLESYTFTFTVETLDNNNNSVFTTPTETGSLTNNPPAINNSNASIINVARGQSLILTIDAVNGSNSGGGKETDDLTFAITSQSRNIFSISGLEVLNSDNTAVGLESFTLQVTDAGGATASKTFNINFGEPAADSVFSNFGSYTINDGDGAAFWFTGTSGFSSLTGNEVSILGSQPPFQGWLNGYQAPPNSSNNPINNFICGGGTVAPEFYNKRESGSLTQGTIFVILRPSNTKTISSSNLDSYVNLRYDISTRTNTLTNWTPVDDLNGVSTVTNNNGVPSGTWEYNNAQTEQGLTATTNTNGSYGANGGLFVSNKQTTTVVFPFGALVFAFNTVGDYRIILGNLQSSYGVYNNSVNCSTQPDFNASAQLIIGDFYNPPIQVQNPNDKQTYGSTYRYEIVGPSAACSSTFNGVYKYAKEPFAKYVTRFYNDTDFLQPYNPITSASFKFRRMDRVDSADGNDIYNPEFTKEGAYTAYILSNGLVNSTPQPCLY